MSQQSASAVVIDFQALRKVCSQCSLRQLCLPAGIAAADVSRLDRLVRRRRPLARGDYLFRSGSPMTSLFVSREGAFKTVALGEDGETQVIGFHLPGELIGLDGLGDGVHRCESVALEEASVCEVPLADLSRIASEIPSLQTQLFRVMGRSMGRDQDHVEMLGRRHAGQRVALFLHSISERLKALGQADDVVRLPMSREDLASFLGLVIETVSRTLSKMQDEGIIEVQGRKLRVLDHARLDRMVCEPEERGKL